MINIFKNIEIGGISFRNRIIRAATHEGMADRDGFPTENLKNTYIRLAKGGIGGIITGYAGVTNRGKSDNYNMLMINNDEYIDKYKELTDEVHNYGVPIVLQIAHTGRQTSSKVTGINPVAPSALKDKIYNNDRPDEATIEDINYIIKAFISAAIRSEKAGFDGVEIHVAHGYLLSSFLSNNSNIRKDQWGGSLENRYRIIDRIIKGIKKNQTDYPVFVKINGYDFQKNGMREDEAVQLAKLLEESGCDAIEVSCGVVADGLVTARGKEVPVDAILEYNSSYKDKNYFVKKLLRQVMKKVMESNRPTENYNVSVAEKIKKVVGIPVIVVGGIKRKEDIVSIINNNEVDMVSMSRPLILEPNLIEKFQQGKSDESKCIDCNYCLMAAQSKPLRCYYGEIRK